MGQRLHSEFLFDIGGNVTGVIVRDISSRSVGHADKVRLADGQLFNGIINLFQAGFSFRRKNFQGKNRLFLFK